MHEEFSSFKQAMKHMISNSDSPPQISYIGPELVQQYLKE